MDCGLLLKKDGEAAGEEAPGNLCPNPTCGVANPPGARFCQRCEDPLPLPPGTVVHAQYRLERFLNKGAIATVYRATDTRAANRPVVLKELTCPNPSEFTTRLDLLRREAETLRSLERSPLTLRVYGLIEEQQAAFLVLEHLEGAALAPGRERTYPPEQVVVWAECICDLLVEAHAQTPPLVGLDFEPEGLLLLPDHKTIRLVSYPVGRRPTPPTAAGKPRKSIRAFREIGGYRAPEEFTGGVEPRSDLFTLAATLHELATGEEAEGNATAEAIRGKLAARDCPYPEAYRWFFELLSINLAEDPEGRYGSARELKQDLERRQVTRQVQCPRCLQMNPVRRPFCLACCQPLTELAPFPCRTCAGRNRMGSRQCVHCGTALH
jgi:serine/threonine protein kinase